MRKVMIACGGTGGHLAPGIALAQGLQKRGVDAVLLISEKQVDARLVQNYSQFEFIPVPSAPLVLSPGGLFRFGSKQTKGILQCRQLIREHRPDLLMAFGGFTSMGAVISARREAIPVVLHEANRKVGRAIRFLKCFASRIYLPPGIRLPGASRKQLRNVGFPVRDEIRRLPREAARKKLGLNSGGKWIMILGGSQGAAALNDWVKQHFESLAAENINLYCLTGLGKGGQGSISHKTGTQENQAVFAPFSDDMGTVISAADLVISRAGAGSIAELIRCRKPSILIPYPYAADNHQAENAHYLERQGGCLVVNQNNLTSLRDEVRDLIFNDWLLNTFETNLTRLDEEDSTAVILDDLERLVNVAQSKGKDQGASAERAGV